MAYYRMLNDEGDWIIQIQRNGRRYTKRGTGGEDAASKEEEKFLAKIERDLEVKQAKETLGLRDEQIPTKPSAALVPTLRDFFEKRYVKHAPSVQNATTRKKTRYPFQYLLYYLGDLTLDEVGERKVINQFVEKMIEKGPLTFERRRDGKLWKPRCQVLTNATINKSLQRLRALLNLAHEERVIASKPKIDLLPEENSVPVIPPTEEQFQHLLEVCGSYVDRAPLLPEIVEFVADTGLRLSEVFRLTVRSVDLDRRCIRVEKQKRARVVNGQVWKPKNKSWREIPLSKRAYQIAKERAEDAAPDDLLFPNRGGAPYVRIEADDTEGKGHFRDAVADADLKGVVTFHTLRHLFAVRLLTRGVPIAVVSELLGHSDINLTVKRYGRFASDAQVKWEAVKALDPVPKRRRRPRTPRAHSQPRSTGRKVARSR